MVVLGTCEGLLFTVMAELLCCLGAMSYILNELIYVVEIDTTLQSFQMRSFKLKGKWEALLACSP